jgi:ribosomal protein S18 acetylase RimI-like enzyme
MGAKAGKGRWKKIGGWDALETEAFLKSLEPCCVAACSKFLGRKSMQDDVWDLLSPDGSVSAVLIHSGRSLLPVFAGIRQIPVPRFLKRFPGRVPVHSVQGLFGDTDILEEAMSRLGYAAAERRSYDLMALDGVPKTEGVTGGFRGLMLREAGHEDAERLFPLQAGYDREEVLPKGAAFNSQACRLNLARILSREQVLAACIGDRVVGKINTNAVSFTCIQIGGVYVLPEYRGCGIARRMTAALAKRIAAEGKKVTLFVRKENAAAQAVYRGLGFTPLADYRISYF